MKIKEKAISAIICMLITFSLTACGGEKSSETTAPGATTVQSESISAIDESITGSQTVSGEAEFNNESSDEDLIDAGEGETVVAEIPEGYSAIGGTWNVRGVYIKGNLIDVNDNDAIKSMYSTTMITFNEDGTFVYLKMYNDRGVWSEHKKNSEDSFILKTESTFMYGLENGSLVEKETDTSNKKQYIATLLDENTFILNEYDAITGKAKANDDPYIFVKEGEESEYLAQNKTPLSDNGSSKPGASIDSSQNKKPANANTTTGERNALSKAKDYLAFTAFSYDGLIEQLEYEGFSPSEAQYGADNCGADWNEQAAEKARQYLEYFSFSQSELIDQLVFEGFTQEQAEYGVNQAY